MNRETEQLHTIHIPRLVVAAVQGRSGKTTFTIGLQRALRERGLLLQGFKKGPDYIDPSWSTFASGVPCRNLDGVMMSREQILHSFITHARDKDIAIVEGDVSDPAIRTIRLDTDDLAVAVSNEHPLASRPSVTIDELRCERLILRLPSSGTRTLFDANLESRGMSPDDFNVILEVDNIATIKDLVRRNYGVSVLARSACMDELRKGKIRMLPIEDLTMVRQINLLYHHTFEHAEVFQDIVRIYNAATREGSVG